jgi:hypothetical protein
MVGWIEFGRPLLYKRPIAFFKSAACIKRASLGVNLGPSIKSASSTFNYF